MRCLDRRIAYYRDRKRFTERHPTRCLERSIALCGGLATVLGGLAGCAGPVNPEPEGDGPAAVVPDCSITADDAITSDEWPLVPGIAATYVRNAPGEAFTFPPGGDFRDGPDGAGATFVTKDPADAWYAAWFPGAEIASPLLVETPELVGVYRFDEAAGELLLLGVTTKTEVPAAQRTLIVYDEPVVTMRFPLTPGLTWGQTATFRDATIAGVPNAGVEDWHFAVADDVTAATLPGDIGVEQVLVVTSTLTRTAAVSLGQPTMTTERESWMAPCFGEIAGRSDDEYRRLVP